MSSLIETFKAAYKNAHGREITVTVKGNRFNIDGRKFSYQTSSLPLLIEGLNEMAQVKAA